jgi:hypothetical protein
LLGCGLVKPILESGEPLAWTAISFIQVVSR